MDNSQGVALIADDAPINQELFGAILKSLGLEVLSAKNGGEAIDIVTQRINDKQRLDVIFMDMMMPVVSGIEATEKIRELGFAGPILVFSADVSRKTANRALEAGANHYFMKSTISLDLARALIDKFCFVKLK